MELNWVGKISTYCEVLTPQSHEEILGNETLGLCVGLVKLSCIVFAYLSSVTSCDNRTLIFLRGTTPLSCSILVVWEALILLFVQRRWECDSDLANQSTILLQTTVVSSEMSMWSKHGQWMLYSTFADAAGKEVAYSWWVCQTGRRWAWIF